MKYYSSAPQQQDALATPGTTANTTVLPIPFQLINSSKQLDAYTLSARDLMGWSLGQLPSPIELQPGESHDLKLEVLLPPSGDAANVIMITATSKNDPSAKVTAQVPLTITAKPSSQGPLIKLMGDPDPEPNLNWKAEDVTALTLEETTTLTSTHIAVIPPPAVRGFTSQHIAKLSLEAVSGFTKEQVPHLTMEAVTGFSTYQLMNLKPETKVAFSPTQRFKMTEYIPQFAGVLIQDIFPKPCRAICVDIGCPDNNPPCYHLPLPPCPEYVPPVCLLQCPAYDPPFSLSNLTLQQIATWSDKDIAKIPSSVISALNSQQIANLSPKAVSGFSVEQISSLNPETITGFTYHQILNLKPEVKAALLGPISLPDPEGSPQCYPVILLPCPPVVQCPSNCPTMSSIPSDLNLPRYILNHIDVAISKARTVGELQEAIKQINKEVENFSASKLPSLKEQK